MHSIETVESDSTLPTCDEKGELMKSLARSAALMASGRRLLLLAWAVLALTAGAQLAAPAAQAETSGSITYTSPQGGYGIATWENDSSSERYLSACDYGAKDGLRTVAELAVNGVQYEVHAASGTGTCSGDAWISGLTAGSSFALRACLRNGANGSDVYCDSWNWGVID